MALVGMNRPLRRVGLIVALISCGAAALGAARWSDIAFEIGYAYENGNLYGWTPGFAQDYRKAVQWLLRAAEANHPRAQYMLGIDRAHGWGFPKDVDRAVEWFTKSALNGYGPAEYHLGWMYHKGDDVPRDDDRAIRLLEQAGGQGMAKAHMALGMFHERGEGVPAKMVQALKWYTLAVHFSRSRQGLFDNAAHTKQAQATHDALVARLDQQSVEQGWMLASQWLVHHP